VACVACVAERSAGTEEQARRQTRAVLGAVAGTIPEQDSHDTIVLRLPNDDAEILTPA
jgi:hypothetical protein